MSKRCKVSLTSPLSEAPPEPALRGVSTFWRWLEEHKDFAANYALAKEFKIKRWAAQIPDIVNARVPDKDGKIDPPPLGKGMRAHIKLRVATRKWLLANMPKR